MRARSIKPGFFQNEDLIELPFEYRLLFAGLWAMADREGRLEDRPKKIKLNIFPGDNVDCDAGLTALHERGFVRRYTQDGKRFIQVLNWSKHQRPHSKEAPSTIPAPDEHLPRSVPAPTKAEPSTNLGSGEHALTPSSLTPDSGLLTADSSSLRSHGPAKPARARKAESEPAEFVEIRREYPRRAGSQRWGDALKHWHRRLAEGTTSQDILAGVKRYAAFAKATGIERTQHVQQVATFLGDNRGYLELWHPPPRPETAMDRILRANGGPDNSRVIEHDPELRALTG